MATGTPARRITGHGGLTGHLLRDLPADSSQSVEVELEDGTRILVPADALQPLPGGGYHLPISAADVQRSFANVAGNQAAVQTGDQVIPVVQEQVTIEKQLVDTARVRIRKRVSEYVEEVAPELMREEVEVHRVAVNRYVDGPMPPHEDGDTLVIPLLEEVLVVEKRLLLREEIRITKARVPAPSTPQHVVLRREDVEVERIPLATAEPQTPRRS